MTTRSLIRSGVRAVLVPLLRAQEPFLVNGGDGPQMPPTFIIGAPRAGTTVLYQLVTDQLRVSYFCNFAASFPLAPVAATRLIRREIRNHRSNFTSSYGSTSERAGPNEGYRIWLRWFKWARAPGVLVSAKDAKNARGTVAALERMLGGSFVNKDPHHSARIRALCDVFPRCVFLWLRRDPLAAARSLLTARRESPRCSANLPLEQIWWGHRPREYDLIKRKHYIDQVCEQVYYTERNILEDLSVVGPERCLEVRYERLCDGLAAELARIACFLEQRGVYVQPTRRRIPQLNTEHKWDVSEAESQMMRSRLRSLYAEPALTIDA